MLIEDADAPRFAFRTGIGKGISRLMNLTHFVGLDETGAQLLVFQTYADGFSQSEEVYLDILKKNDLVSSEARIIKAENYIYEQEHFQLAKDVKNASLVL